MKGRMDEWLDAWPWRVPHVMSVVCRTVARNLYCTIGAVVHNSSRAVVLLRTTFWQSLIEVPPPPRFHRLNPRVQVHARRCSISRDTSANRHGLECGEGREPESVISDGPLLRAAPHDMPAHWRGEKYRKCDTNTIGGGGGGGGGGQGGGRMAAPQRPGTSGNAARFTAPAPAGGPRGTAGVSVSHCHTGRRQPGTGALCF
jgi:hypothetical protein